jgi:hypothetical protein
MPEPTRAPTCPKCGAAMVRRVRGFDGSPFWGCSTFPVCRGTREFEADAPGAKRSASPSRSRHYDQWVLACGAVGLFIGLGFIFVSLFSKPGSYALVGLPLIALMALVVAPSPLLPLNVARRYAFTVAFLSVLVAMFFIAWIPVSTWYGQILANQMLQAMPTIPVHTPSITP